MDIQALRAEQLQRAAEVVRHDDFDVMPPRLIGGADVGFEQDGEVTRAAMVILEYPSLKLIEYKVARIATIMPYIPGFLSFREYPALLAAWEMLEQKPDLLFVDGHGISHPRRLGVASHFGMLPATVGPCGQGARPCALPGAVLQRGSQGVQRGIVEARSQAMPVCVLPQAVELLLFQRAGRCRCGRGMQHRVWQLLEQGPDRDQCRGRRRAGQPATGRGGEHQSQGLRHCAQHRGRQPGAAQLPVFPCGGVLQLHRGAFTSLLQRREGLFKHALQALAHSRRHVPA